MRATKTRAAAILALALGAAAGTAAAQTHEHEHAASTAAKKTLQGEVLDMACYMGHEAKGEKHKSCAQACIKGGAPMGLLTAEGQVILLVEDHEAKKPYDDLKAKGGEQVKVTGTEQERGGLTALVVQSFEPAK